MVLEGLRGYLQIASGLTDVTRQRATSVAQSLLSQGSELTSGLPLVGDLREQVTGVAEDLLATSRANREMLLGLVRGEVERQVTRLGLVSASELEAATKRAQRLEVRVHDLEVRVAAQSGRATAAPAPAARTGASSRAAAPAATVEPAAPAASSPAPATKAPATKAPARKAPGTKAPATKAPATKAPARRVATKAARAAGQEQGPEVAAAPTAGERAAARRAVSGARARKAAKGGQP